MRRIKELELYIYSLYLLYLHGVHRDNLASTVHLLSKILLCYVQFNVESLNETAEEYNR